MTSNLLPEEIRAILELLPKSADNAPTGEVSSRDFHRPKRLSSETRAALVEQVVRLAPELQRELQAALRGKLTIELVDLDEMNCDGLFEQLEDPFAIVRFEVRGELGWAIWDLAGAVGSIETSLGMPEVKDCKARKLASVEKTMLKRLVSYPLQRLAKLWKLDLKDVRVVDIREELGTWRDAGPTADSQRVAVQFAIDGPGGQSTLRLYLPGVVGNSPAPAAAKKPAPTAQAPEHIAGVPFEVSVRLGSSEIVLADLLHLEIGDVIPLGTRTDEPLRLVVEDRVCADVKLGMRDGNLATKVERLRPRGREE
ncbi:MAG: FliM/FliN family flagellar motor switch protein [Planctomycetes bacterium]|nr:FliM/FliN family flagellar motor switch protein [Planctomycetota bacterium]